MFTIRPRPEPPYPYPGDETYPAKQAAYEKADAAWRRELAIWGALNCCLVLIGCAAIAYAAWAVATIGPEMVMILAKP